MTQLHIVTCGGTFEKRYDPIAGNLSFSESHIEPIVHRCRFLQPPDISTPFLKDSLEMSEADREHLKRHLAGLTNHRIVIIHGTDTLVESAQALTRCTDLLDKVIVLTGAMVPYDLVDSDALFNLGFACACALLKTPGVYIAMNGQLHTANAVRKDRKVGLFIPTESS